MSETSQQHINYTLAAIGCLTLFLLVQVVGARESPLAVASSGLLSRRSGGSGYGLPKSNTELAVSFERVKNPDAYKKKKFPITWLRNQYPFNSYYKKKRKHSPPKETMMGQYSSEQLEFLDPNPSTWVRLPDRPTATVKFQKQSGYVPPPYPLAPPPSLQMAPELPMEMSPYHSGAPPLHSVPNELMRPQSGGGMMLSESQQNYAAAPSVAAPPQEPAADGQSGFGGISLSFGNGRSISFGGGQGLTIGGRAGAISIGGKNGPNNDNAPAASGYSETKGGYAPQSGSYPAAAGGGSSYGNGYDDGYVNKNPTMSVDMPRKGKTLVHANLDMAPIKFRLHSSPRVKITTGSRDPLEKPGDDELSENEEDIFEPPEPFVKQNATAANETSAANATTGGNATETTTLSPMQLNGFGGQNRYPQDYNHFNGYNIYGQQQDNNQQQFDDSPIMPSYPNQAGQQYAPGRQQLQPIQPVPPIQSMTPIQQQQQIVQGNPMQQGQVPMEEQPQFVPPQPHNLPQYHQFALGDGQQGLQPLHQIQQVQQQVQQKVPLQNYNQMPKQHPPPPSQFRRPQQFDEPPTMQQQPQVPQGDLGRRPPVEVKDQRPAVNQWRQARQQMQPLVAKQADTPINENDNGRFYNPAPNSNSIVESGSPMESRATAADLAASGSVGSYTKVAGQAAPKSPPLANNVVAFRPPEHPMQLASLHQPKQQLDSSLTKQPVVLQQSAALQQTVPQQQTVAKVQGGPPEQQIQAQASGYQPSYGGYPPKGHPPVASSYEPPTRTITFGNGGISTHYGGGSPASSYGSGSSYGGSPGGSYGGSYGASGGTVPSDGFDQRHYAAKVEKFDPDAHDKRERSKVVLFLRPRISIHTANSSTTTKRPKNAQRNLYVINRPIFLNNTRNMTHHDEDFLDPDLKEPMDVPYGYGYGYGGYGSGYGSTRGYNKTSTTSTTKKPKTTTTTTTTTTAPETETTTTSAPTTTTDSSETSSTTTLSSSSESDSSSSESPTTSTERSEEGSSESTSDFGSSSPSSSSESTSTEGSTSTTGSSSTSAETETSESPSSSSTPEVNILDVEKETTTPEAPVAVEVTTQEPASDDLVASATETMPTTSTSTTSTTTTTTTTAKTPIKSRYARPSARPTSTSSTTKAASSSTTTTTTTTPAPTTTTTTLAPSTTSTTSESPPPPRTSEPDEEEENPETSSTTSSTSAPSTSSSSSEEPEFISESQSQSKRSTRLAEAASQTADKPASLKPASAAKIPTPLTPSKPEPMLLNEDLIEKLMSNKTLVNLMSGQLKRVINTERMDDQEKQRLVRQVFEQMKEEKVDFSMNNVRLAVKTVSSSYRAAVQKQRRRSTEAATVAKPSKSAAGPKGSERRNDSSRSFPAIDTALKLTKRASSTAAGSPSTSTDSSGNPIVVVLLPQDKAAA